MGELKPPEEWGTCPGCGRETWLRGNEAACDYCKPTLTVAQAITALSVMPPDAPIVVEGCDCMGRATNVQEPDDFGVVVIRRAKGCGYEGAEAFDFEERVRLGYESKPD